MYNLRSPHLTILQIFEKLPILQNDRYNFYFGQREQEI